jgi:hypothetical protein
MAEGGIASVKRFQLGGLSAVDLMNSSLADVKRMASMGEPGAAEELSRRLKNQGLSSARMPSPAMSEMNLSNPRVVGGAPAAAAAPAAASPAAAATGPSYQSLTGPTYGQRLLNFLKPAGIGGPGAAVGAGGAGLSALSANYLDRLPDESLQYLGGAMDDTGLAANILLQGRENESKGIATRKPAVTAPAAAPVTPPKKTTLPPTGAGAGRGEQGGMSFADLAQQAREEEYAANQEASDKDEGRFMDLYAKQKEEEGKKEAETKEEPQSKLEQLLERRMGNLEKQKDIDNYMALLSAGLGMMGGTSPYAGANIGQGAQAGIASYLRSGATRAAEENAILSGQLGLERYKGLADIRKQGIQSQRALKEMELGLREKIAEGQQLSKTNAQAIQQQKMYQGRLEQIEKLAQNQALAEFKGALLPEQKEQILAQATNALRMDPGYRDLYKKVHGFDPGAQIRTYDPSTGKLR